MRRPVVDALVAGDRDRHRRRLDREVRRHHRDGVVRVGRVGGGQHVRVGTDVLVAARAAVRHRPEVVLVNQTDDRAREGRIVFTVHLRGVRHRDGDGLRRDDEVRRDGVLPGADAVDDDRVGVGVDEVVRRVGDREVGSRDESDAVRLDDDGGNLRNAGVFRGRDGDRRVEDRPAREDVVAVRVVAGGVVAVRHEVGRILGEVAAGDRDRAPVGGGEIAVEFAALDDQAGGVAFGDDVARDPAAGDGGTDDGRDGVGDVAVQLVAREVDRDRIRDDDGLLDIAAEDDVRGDRIGGGGGVDGILERREVVRRDDAGRFVRNGERHRHGRSDRPGHGLVRGRAVGPDVAGLEGERDRVLAGLGRGRVARDRVARPRRNARLRGSVIDEARARGGLDVLEPRGAEGAVAGRAGADLLHGGAELVGPAGERVALASGGEQRDGELALGVELGVRRVVRAAGEVVRDRPGHRDRERLGGPRRQRRRIQVGLDGDVRRVQQAAEVLRREGELLERRGVGGVDVAQLHRDDQVPVGVVGEVEGSPEGAAVREVQRPDDGLRPADDHRAVLLVREDEAVGPARRLRVRNGHPEGVDRMPGPGRAVLADGRIRVAILDCGGTPDIHPQEAGGRCGDGREGQKQRQCERQNLVLHFVRSPFFVPVSHCAPPNRIASGP